MKETANSKLNSSLPACFFLVNCPTLAAVNPHETAVYVVAGCEIACACADPTETAVVVNTFRPGYLYLGNSNACTAAG